MIGAGFEHRLSGRPPSPFPTDDDTTCPICVGPTSRCVGPHVEHDDMASRTRELAVARGQQQTRRAPGRPASDPAKEAERQADWAARQATETPEPEPVATPEAPVSDTVADEVEPRAAEVPAGAAPPVAAAVPVTSEPAVAPAPALDPGVQSLSPIGLGGRTVNPDAGSPRFTEGPSLVRTGDGAFKSQGVDHRAVGVAIPAEDPTEVKDCYVVPEGVIDPVDDPHRPDPETTVLVSDANQLIATGAWASLPGGVSIVTTKKVLRVWFPMGTLSPSYSTVADVGAVLPRPTAA